MQILDSIQTHPDTNAEPELMAVLEDIARNVEIRDDFSIHHPSYKPIEIPADAVERFQRMPEQIKQKFLSLQLRSFLYGIYYNGSMRSDLALDSEEQPVQLDLENNTVMGIDTAFFRRLHDRNCGAGYFDNGWRVLKEEDGCLVVKKGGLQLHIQREKHLSAAEQQSQVGDTVAIKMPKNRMQSGFYMAVSNLGFSRPEGEDVLVRIYFNLTPDGSVALMESLTQRLNDINIPFSFKVLYNPKSYKRFDSAVLYFDKRTYGVVAEVIKGIYPKFRAYLKPEIPLFTKKIAVGVGLAEEPDRKFAERESFGMNRCQIVANGLIKSQKEASENRLKFIENEFLDVSISIVSPYVNSSSYDIYIPF